MASSPLPFDRLGANALSQPNVVAVVDNVRPVSRCAFPCKKN